VQALRDIWLLLAWWASSPGIESGAGEIAWQASRFLGHPWSEACRESGPSTGAPRLRSWAYLTDFTLGCHLVCRVMTSFVCSAIRFPCIWVRVPFVKALVVCGLVLCPGPIHARTSHMLPGASERPLPTLSCMYPLIGDVLAQVGPAVRRALPCVLPPRGSDEFWSVRWYLICTVCSTTGCIPSLSPCH
jgi:hypothetical protein